MFRENLESYTKKSKAMNQSLSITGYITKEEKVSGLKGHRMRNTFVLDVNHPFPGYFGQDMFEQSVAGSIIFLTKKQHSWEQILRAKKRINAYLDIDVDITKVKVTMWNKNFHGIRANNFQGLEYVETYQKALVEEGFAMARSRSMNEEEEALINLKKFFFLDKVADGVFRDVIKKDMSYVLLDKYVNWEVFRQVTTSVKQNISDSSFDVAKGAFYLDNSIVDMIRIFKPGISLELLTEINEMYKKYIAKYG